MRLWRQKSKELVLPADERTLAGESKSSDKTAYTSFMSTLNVMDENTILNDVPRYPPFSEGIPIHSAEELLASQKKLVTRIMNMTGYDEQERIRYFEQPLLNYAAFVNLLSASESHHHAGVGGLLRHGLETGYKALEICNASHRFATDGWPSENREREKAWRLSAFLAGLFHDAAKPATDIYVTNQKGDCKWLPFKGCIYDWASEHNIDRFYVTWVKGRGYSHESLTPYIVKDLLGDTLIYLDAYPDVLNVFTNVLAGREVSHKLQEIILEADNYSVSLDRTNTLPDNTKMTPYEWYLMDAIMRLIASQEWLPNVKDSPLWVFEDGVYLSWQRACKDALALLESEKIPGIPQNPEVLADSLIEKGLAFSNTTQEGDFRYWPMTCDVLVDGDGNNISLNTVRFSKRKIYNDDPPDAQQGWVFTRQDQKLQQAGQYTPPQKKADSERDDAVSSTVKEVSRKSAVATKRPLSINAQLKQMPGGDLLHNALSIKDIFFEFVSNDEGEDHKLYIAYPECVTQQTDAIEPLSFIKDLKLSKAIYCPEVNQSVAQYKNHRCIIVVGEIATLLHGLYQQEKPKPQRMAKEVGHKREDNPIHEHVSNDQSELEACYQEFLELLLQQNCKVGSTIQFSKILTVITSTRDVNYIALVKYIQKKGIIENKEHKTVVKCLPC